jgi:cation:H+ antiporter
VAADVPLDGAGRPRRPGRPQPRLAVRGRALTGAALLLLAAALLVGGAELFVDNLAGAARRLGLTALAVGVLLAGAEPEELVTAALASAQDRPGLAVGDAIGANVTMLTAALGLAALVRPLPVGVRVRRYAVGAALAGALAAAALAGGRVTRLEGALLLAAYAGLVALVWWRERTPPAIGELAERDEDDDERAPGVALALALLGLAVMTSGGVAAVEGATRVVADLGRSDTEVGLTVLALATTAELFALVLAAARRGVEEVAIAAVVGSAAYNATATLGVAALVHPLTSEALAASVLAAALPLAVVAVAPHGRLGRPAAGALAAAYVVFVVRTLG